MTIVKWRVSSYATTPERREYDSETKCFYLYRTGRMNVARRDAKSSTYCRYFDSKADALEFIRQRAESKADQKRVDQINRCGVELLEALEGLLESPLIGNPTSQEIIEHWEYERDQGNGWAEPNLKALAAIAKAKGLA